MTWKIYRQMKNPSFLVVYYNVYCAGLITYSSIKNDKFNKLQSNKYNYTHNLTCVFINSGLIYINPFLQVKILYDIYHDTLISLKK